MKIVNSLTGQKEDLIPIKQGQFNIYACGPTVYNFIHIGNARPLVVFDTLRRYLEYRGNKVNYVQNFTDVDDKMIAAANTEGITVQELGDRYINEYFKDADALQVKRATVHPKATEHIEEIVALVQKLIDTGHAYESDGDVYFDTQSFSDYGKLSRQDLTELELGHRVEVSGQKKNPMDFALWKAQKPGEVAWDSPWGAGRPGWHIECSAMSMKYLGETLDIHGGGQDLQFPHHENEIAQSEAATGKPFANYWVHNGYINVDGTKMAKSKGNYFTVRDILKEFDGTAIRLFMLDSHYASPINFTRDLLEQSAKAYTRIQNCRENLKFIIKNGKDVNVNVEDAIRTLDERFNESMDDDLNTAGAVGAVFEYVKAVNTLFENGGRSQDAQQALDALDVRLDVLGLMKEEKEEEVPADVLALAEARSQARQAKDWAKSDKLRDEIRQLGYEIKDTPEGANISRI